MGDSRSWPEVDQFPATEAAWVDNGLKRPATEAINFLFPTLSTGGANVRHVTKGGQVLAPTQSGF